MTPKWVVQELQPENDPGGDPYKFIIKAPIGMKVVGVGAQGMVPAVLALVNLAAPMADHPFIIFPPNKGHELLLGKSLGDAWPVAMQGPGGQSLIVVVAKEMPWPEPRKFMLEKA